MTMKVKTKIMMERISLVSSARLVFFFIFCIQVTVHHLHNERVVAARELQQTFFEDGPSN